MAMLPTGQHPMKDEHQAYTSSAVHRDIARASVTPPSTF
jgi:hypothetical protein